MNKDGKMGGIVDAMLVIRAGIYFLITTAIFVLLFAMIMFFSETGYEYTAIFGTVSVAAGILVSSFLTAKKIGKKGFLTGITVGLIVFALVTIVSLIIDDSSFTVNTLFHLIIYVLAGAIGGILGVNKTSNTKYI